MRELGVLARAGNPSASGAGGDAGVVCVAGSGSGRGDEDEDLAGLVRTCSAPGLVGSPVLGEHPVQVSSGRDKEAREALRKSVLAASDFPQTHQNVFLCASARREEDCFKRKE